MMLVPQKKIGDLSLVDYAKSICGVYIWMTARDAANHISHELMCFLTDGQRAG
jgi:hypothetical protein